MEDLSYDELGKNIWVYIDDMIVFTHTLEEDVKDVMNGCSKLQNAGYYANLKTRAVFATKRYILGHIMDHDGIDPGRQKIWNIIHLTRPENQKELPRMN